MLPLAVKPASQPCGKSRPIHAGATALCFQTAAAARRDPRLGPESCGGSYARRKRCRVEDRDLPPSGPPRRIAPSGRPCAPGPARPRRPYHPSAARQLTTAGKPGRPWNAAAGHSQAIARGVARSSGINGQAPCESRRAAAAAAATAERSSRGLAPVSARGCGLADEPLPSSRRTCIGIENIVWARGWYSAACARRASCWRACTHNLKMTGRQSRSPPSNMCVSPIPKAYTQWSFCNR